MKQLQKLIASALFVGVMYSISCKKEHSCEGCITGNKPPIANAGTDQAIALPKDSVLLDGSASSDPDGTITSYKWAKIAGPASANIAKPDSTKTVVKSLAAGVYQFELTVTDNGGLSAKDTVQIMVDGPGNQPPVACAGADQTIALPTNFTTLDGSCSADPDNNITSYVWTKISGPSSFNINNAVSVQTQVTSLVQGVYLFELKVADAGGLTSKDTVQFNVVLSSSLCNSNRPMVNAQLVPIGILSKPRAAMAIAAAGGKILFAGGLEASSGTWVASSRVDIYDFANNTWSTAELSIGRYSIAATAAGNKIFFAGGETGDGTWPVDSVDIYDVSTNTWTVDHLRAPGNSIAAATVANKVLFAGGDGGSTANAGIGRVDRRRHVDIFDISTNTWTGATLTEPKYGISAVTINNKVLFAGGFTFSDKSRKIEIYDNANGSWFLDTLHEKKSHHGAIATGNRIFWAGGTNDSPDPYTCQVEITNVTTGSRSIEYLFRPAGWSSYDGQHLVMKNNKIIFLSTWGPYMNKFDIYDLAVNTWSVGILLQAIPQGSSFISANNEIYVAGGSVNGVVTSQVWKLDF